MHSFTEMIEILLSGTDDRRFVLTDRFNQDPVEIYFGQQRSRGHRNDNPSVQQYMKNCQAIIVQKSLALGGSSNISKRKRDAELSPLCQPLPKRLCKRVSDI